MAFRGGRCCGMGISRMPAGDYDDYEECPQEVVCPPARPRPCPPARPRPSPRRGVYVCPASSGTGRCPSATSRRVRIVGMGDDDNDDDDDDDNSSDEAVSNLPKTVQRVIDQAARGRKKVSRVKLFDAAVTTELKNLRSSKGHQVLHPMARKIVEDTRAVDDKKPHSASLLASLESSKSWLKIGAEFRHDRDNDFLRAVERLARAEASCHFDGAVRAAEAAAAKAPPELREEAALEGARNYQAMIMDSFQGKLPGPKPVEVLGYIGITGPK